MRVLISNDDGIHAPGLEVLERIAAQFSDDIWVVAPENDQSGFAHSLTLNEPLRLREVSHQKFGLKGTPTDCVIMGVRELMGEAPDLILSGVNNGQNIGDDITYSGTVAAAMEGTLLEIPSIALSQAYAWDGDVRKINWQTVETYAPDLIKKLMVNPFPEKTLINLNFPNCSVDEVTGIEVTRQGSFDHGLSMEKRLDGRNSPYYWLRYSRDIPDQIEGSDVVALREKRISITPITLDWTHEQYMSDLATLVGDNAQ